MWQSIGMKSLFLILMRELISVELKRWTIWLGAINYTQNINQRNDLIHSFDQPLLCYVDLGKTISVLNIKGKIDSDTIWETSKKTASKSFRYDCVVLGDSEWNAFRTLAPCYELVSKSLGFLEPLAHSNLIYGLNRTLILFATFDEMILTAPHIAHRKRILGERIIIIT